MASALRLLVETTLAGCYRDVDGRCIYRMMCSLQHGYGDLYYYYPKHHSALTKQYRNASVLSILYFTVLFQL